MRITKKDLDFLVKLENYLGRKENWSPMVRRLWRLNDRLISEYAIEQNSKTEKCKCKCKADETEVKGLDELPDDLKQDVIDLLDAISESTDDDSNDNPKYVINVRMKRRKK